MAKHTPSTHSPPQSQRHDSNQADHDHDDDHDNDHEHDNDQDQDRDEDDHPSRSTGGSTPIKRKRLTQACDPCRKKKIKCDGLKPSCANCAKIDIHCTYLPSMKKRGPRQGYIELLEKRLDKMEKMLQHGPAAIDSDFKVSLRSASEEEDDNSESTAGPPAAADARYFGRSSALGYYADTDSKLTHPMVQNYGNVKPNAIRSDQRASITAAKRPIYGIKDEVPRKDILDHLIQLFFDSVYYQFPIVHPGSFMKQYREGKVSPNLLNGICAGVARFSNHPDVVTTPPFLAGEPFATNVRASIVDSVDIPTVSNVQALLFLSMYEYGAARGPRAWMFGGMAIRMAQELGLNREDSSPVFYLKGDWVLRETRRRTFWACFIMDVLSSSSSGRPRMIDERDCEVLLPSEDNAWHEARPVVTEMLDDDQGPETSTESFKEQRQSSQDRQPDDQGTDANGMATPPSESSAEAEQDKPRPKGHSLSSFAYLIRILAVLGKVSQYVNRPRTKKSIPPNEPGSEFSIIDAALAAWLQSIPSHLIYSPENARMLKDRNEGCIIIFMHVIYHTSVVLLHRPILAADKASFPMDPNFVDNSVARCAEAASKVSEVLDFVSAQNYPPRIYISSFFAYPVFTTATIHITNAFASDLAVASKARRNLSTHVKILQTMKTYWAMADKFFYIIRDLYSIQSKISSSAAGGGIIVPQVVSHNAHGCSRDYAADSAANALKAKEAPRAGDAPEKDEEKERQGLEGEAVAPRMVVNSKLASISSFLKSDSGLIALWRRATEMQVIDQANQQKRRIATPEGPSKIQPVVVQDQNDKEQAEKDLREQRNRMNQLEIQEINQEFERQWKVKILEEQKQQNDELSQHEGVNNAEIESSALEKRQTEGDDFANPRVAKQARTSRTSTIPATSVAEPPQPVAQQNTYHSNSASVRSPTNTGTWSRVEEDQRQPIGQPASSLQGNQTYRHALLQQPEQLQQLRAQDAYMMEPMLLQPGNPIISSVSPAQGDVGQRLMSLYSQQHQQQETISQAINMRQNANIQQQHQKLQQQRQQASVSSSLAFGPPGGFSSAYLPSSSAPAHQQQTMMPFQPQHQQHQQGAFSGAGFGPPLVYGSSFSQNNSSRVQAELTDSIFDFAMPLGDLNFLSSSFQMTPMMMEQNHSNSTPNMSNTSGPSSAALSSMSALSRAQPQSQLQQPRPRSLGADSGPSPAARRPGASASSTSMMLTSLDSNRSDMSSTGSHVPRDSKSPSSTQNISPGLHSFMMSDDAFAEMQSTPDSLVRYLQLHHQQQQRQEMQLQRDMQPLLNQQNSLIYDDYFQWSQLLPAASSKPAARPFKPN
ncbi:hypothetical protein BGZ54_009523 [Gamsiella multidivaricata]|nr:hypothetical protein BGZ54_009523 [Gamsiella multidivaricata]